MLLPRVEFIAARKHWSQILCLDFYRTAVALLITTVISIYELNPAPIESMGLDLQIFLKQEPVFRIICAGNKRG